MMMTSDEIGLIGMGLVSIVFTQILDTVVDISIGLNSGF
jgi:hypothetical protein